MYDHVERGDYLIGKKVMYFRSKWEANYALYLEFLKERHQIKRWTYEPKFFDFPVKHGVTRYLPDFEVEENDGSIWYPEVKGFMDSKSKTKLKRMAKYYPQIKVIIIDKEFMQGLKKMSKLLKLY